MVGKRYEQSVAQRFAHGFDQFGVRRRIHRRHALFAVTGIPVPEIHAIKSVFGNDRLHLRREIGDLRIGEVAESQSLAAAFDADADLAALILQRTDILGRMAEDIAHVGTQIQ